MREITFEFLGQCFTLRSNLSEEEINEVLAFLEERKAEVERHRKVPAYKLAIWLLFQVAYELIKLKKDKAELESYLKAQSKKLEAFLENDRSTLGYS